MFFFNPFCSLLVCTFFIGSGKSWVKASQGRGALKVVQFVRKLTNVCIPRRWS